VKNPEPTRYWMGKEEVFIFLFPAVQKTCTREGILFLY